MTRVIVAYLNDIPPEVFECSDVESAVRFDANFVTLLLTNGNRHIINIVTIDCIDIEENTHARN